MKARVAREQIAGCAHALWERGLVTGSSGNISVRLDNGDILITPTRKALGFLRKSDIVRIDAAGAPQGDGTASSEWRLHVAAYAARDDIEVVVHTHPTFCVVWSAQGRLYPRDTVAATESLRAMKLVPFYPNGSQELADATRDALTDGTPLALLARHGLVAVAREMEDAYVQTDLAEECAKVAYYSAIFGTRALS